MAIEHSEKKPGDSPDSTASVGSTQSPSDFPEWIEVFETGTWTSKEGITKTWTDSDLEEIASSYDPKTFISPLVIGHPEDNSPAYGWVAALKKVGSKLYAHATDIVDEFKDAVKKGMFRKVSMAIFPDMTLKHIGFLGGKAPALKGLKPVFFGEKKAGWTFERDITFMDNWQQETVRSIFQRLRDWIIDKFGLEEADKVINPYAIDDLKPVESKTDTNVAPAFTAGDNAHPNKPSYAQASEGKGGTNMDLGKFFSDLKALIVGAEKELAPPASGTRFSEADLAAAEKRGKDLAFAESQKQLEAETKAKKDAQDKLRAIETKARKDEIAAFCETQCKEGKLTPALRKTIEPAMIAVVGDEMVIEFTEASGTVKKSKLQVLQDFVKALPKLVEFSEVAGDGRAKVVPKDFDTAVKAVMTEKKLSRAKAITFCAREYPELHEEYVSNLTPAEKK